MIVANNGNMAAMFAEEGINSNGTVTRSARFETAFTKARKSAERTMIKMSKDTGQPLGIIIAKMLNSSIPELQSYVQARGESPKQKLADLAIQAALLRSIEIATMAKAIDTDDADALMLIEQAEAQAIEDNVADASYVMRPDTSAAVDLLVYRISDKYRAKGGSGKMADFVNDMRTTSGADNFDGMNCGALVNNADEGFIFYVPEQEQAVTGTTTNANETKTSFWDNIFTTLDKVVDGITKVTTAVNTTVGNVSTTSGGILGQVENIGSDIGAQSIQKYVAENWWKLAIGAIVIVLLIIFVARATKR